MTDLRKIGDSIRKICGVTNVCHYYDVTIKEVDNEKQTVTVESADPDAYFIKSGVRYMPVSCEGDESVPSVGSSCIMVTKDGSDPYITMSSFLDSKTIVIGNQSYKIVSDSQIFNDGEYGGIPKVIDPEDSNAGLLKKINQLEQKYNSLLSSLNSAVITLAPSGTILFSVYLTSNSPISPITSKSEIENKNITHGK